MDDVTCFLLEETEQVRRYLRRYSTASCSNIYGYHEALVPLDDISLPESKVSYNLKADALWPFDQSPWPVFCRCGYRFTSKDTYQIFIDHLYRRIETGEITPLREAPPGAMYYADWLIHGPENDYFKGPDGHSLAVVLPNRRVWLIDTRCSNCTQPQDHHHRCWVRHGVAPNITVDKNGFTCEAGAGSIQAGDYHGFLTNGVLSEQREPGRS